MFGSLLLHNFRVLANFEDTCRRDTGQQIVSVGCGVKTAVKGKRSTPSLFLALNLHIYELAALVGCLGGGDSSVCFALHRKQLNLRSVVGKNHPTLGVLCVGGPVGARAS